jgi:hypothetical protein
VEDADPTTPLPHSITTLQGSYCSKNGVNRLNPVGLDERNMHKLVKKYIHNLGSDISRNNNLLIARSAENIILKLELQQ